MATAPVKPHPLHNFTVSLKWGQTAKLASANSHRHNRGGGGGGSSSNQARPAESDAESDREIVASGNTPPPAATTNSTTVVHRVGSRSTRQQRSSFSPCSSVFQKRVPEEELRKEAAITEVKKETGEAEEEEEGEEANQQRPWKLRPRRGVSCPSGEQTMIQPKEGSQQLQAKSVRLRGVTEGAGGGGGGGVCGVGGGGGGGGAVLEKKEKRKIWIALSKDEIEEDIFSMTGSRPSRRPRKRAKNVQKLLDNIFPGLWLVGNTVDSYRIAETPLMVRHKVDSWLLLDRAMEVRRRRRADEQRSFVQKHSGLGDSRFLVYQDYGRHQVNSSVTVLDGISNSLLTTVGIIFLHSIKYIGSFKDVVKDVVQKMA
ncbi:hypothetical protein LINGRAHAP2_LOCUS25281 [Linum grandiflorum]